MGIGCDTTGFSNIKSSIATRAGGEFRIFLDNVLYDYVTRGGSVR